MRRPAAAVVALAGLVFFSGSAGAFSYAEWAYGDALAPIDGRSIAMGGAGLASADGARGYALNPALVAKAEGVETAFTVLAIAAEEARDIPLHDSFDGVIADNTYALNTAVYDHYIGSIAFRPSGDLAWAPAVAVGYRPRLDMNYTYHVQYRDPDTQTEPNDKVLYDYYADGDGGVNAFTVALGQEVADDVYVGLGVDFLRGDFDAHERWVYPPGSENEDAESRTRYEGVSGTQFAVALLVEKLHRLDIALVYRAGFDLDVDDYSYRAAGSDSVFSKSFHHHYPDAFAVGFEYHPRNLIMTTVNLDIEYTRWSSFEDGLLDDAPELDDTIVYRVGVEHGFYDDTQARFGFVYEPSYVDNRTVRTGFCAGLGLDVLGFRVDVGGELGLREYLVQDGRLRETTTKMMATIVRTF